MRLLFGLGIVVIGTSLGYELNTGDAILKSGGGNVNEEPLRFYFKITFEILLILILAILIVLPKEKLEALNRWLAQSNQSESDDK